MLGYNAFRTIFLFYFVWLLAGTGWLALEALRRRGMTFQLDWEDRLLLGFFLGAALLSLVMFPLGFLKLFYPATALVFSVPILFFSYPLLVCELRGVAGLARRIVAPARGWNLEQVTKALLTTAFLLLALVLLFTRCLYPGETSNDSYEIYWPYQRLVVSSHSLWPNDAWYVFFAFKGAGLNFLAMLLSDGMACQSATFCMLLAAVFAVYSMAKKIGGSAIWALLASVTALACFPFTNPDWGAFQSHHLGAAMWLVCMIWMAVLTFDRTGAEYGWWFGIWLPLAAAAAIFYPLFMIFVIPTLGVMCAGCAFARQWKAARGYLVVILGAGCAMAGVMLLNYLIAGMFLQDPTRPMWKFANQANFSRWCSPYLEVYILEGSKLETGGVSLMGFLSVDLDHWLRLFRVKSLGLLWIYPAVPVILATLALAVAFAPPRRHPVRLIRLVPVLGPLAVSIFIVNSGHPDSVYRNYGFTCFFLPLTLCVLWQSAFELFLPARAKGSFAAVFALLATAVSINGALHRYAAQPVPNASSRWPAFLEFATGRISLRDALNHGDRIWPVAEAAKNVVGINEKIYCFSPVPWSGGIASYLFPGSGLITEPTWGLDRQWATIAFGDAESAAAALKKEQINYFLIDFSQGFRGAIPFSPLFDPGHFAERFDLVWAHGSACLVTWHGKGQPMPAILTDALHQRLEVNRTQPDPHPDGVMGRLYDNMKAIYDYNEGKDYPVRRPPNLPHVMGWQ